MGGTGDPSSSWTDPAIVEGRRTIAAALASSSSGGGQWTALFTSVGGGPVFAGQESKGCFARGNATSRCRIPRIRERRVKRRGIHVAGHRGRRRRGHGYDQGWPGGRTGRDARCRCSPDGIKVQVRGHGKRPPIRATSIAVMDGNIISNRILASSSFAGEPQCHDRGRPPPPKARPPTRNALLITTTEAASINHNVPTSGRCAEA